MCIILTTWVVSSPQRYHISQLCTIPIIWCQLYYMGIISITWYYLYYKGATSTAEIPMLNRLTCVRLGFSHVSFGRGELIFSISQGEILNNFCHGGSYRLDDPSPRMVERRCEIDLPRRLIMNLN